MKKANTNNGLAIIFMIIICYRLIELIMRGQWLYAIFAYVTTGLLLWIAVSIYAERCVNLKLIIVWMPKNIISLFKPEQTQKE